MVGIGRHAQRVYQVYMRKDILERQTEIAEWIGFNLSKAEICRRLKCKPETLQSYLRKMGIEYRGNQGARGYKVSAGYVTALEYIERGAPKSHKLKLKLIKDGIKNHQCEKCLREDWLDGKIPLELHHVDGDHYNNNLDNLKLLCPNCHALEENNSGAARKYGPLSQRQRK